MRQPSSKLAIMPPLLNSISTNVCSILCLCTLFLIFGLGSPASEKKPKTRISVNF